MACVLMKLDSRKTDTDETIIDTSIDRRGKTTLQMIVTYMVALYHIFNIVLLGRKSSGIKKGNDLPLRQANNASTVPQALPHLSLGADEIKPLDISSLLDSNREILSVRSVVKSKEGEIEIERMRAKLSAAVRTKQASVVLLKAALAKQKTLEGLVRDCKITEDLAWGKLTAVVRTKQASVVLLKAALAKQKTLEGDLEVSEARRRKAHELAKAYKTTENHRKKKKKKKKMEQKIVKIEQLLGKFLSVLWGEKKPVLSYVILVASYLVLMITW